MIRRLWPYLSLVIGLVLTVGSCVLLAMLNGLPQIMTTPYTVAGWLTGVAVIVGGLVLPVVLACRRRPSNRDYPVRASRATPLAARRADRERNTSVHRARLRGGSVAGSQRGNGGEPATANTPTEQLPAVEDDSDQLTIILPLWAGRGAYPGRFGRPTKTSVRRSRGCERAMAAASAPREGVEAAAVLLPPVRVRDAHRRGGAAPAGAISVGVRAGAATTTVQLPPVGDPQPVDALRRGCRPAARGEAAPVSQWDGHDGSRPQAQTWTAGDGDLTATAGLNETAYR